MQAEFPDFTREFVERALARFEPWRLGNDVLYRLCKEHRRHDSPAAIIAKFWLIGRSYAAAVERRKRSRDHDRTFFVGDDFYTMSLVPCIEDSGIDLWFEELNSETSSIEVVAIHKKLTEVLKQITGDSKRSLASKYLHFHFPNKYFIYDSRALAALNKVMAGKPYPKSDYRVADVEYAKFFDRCKFVRENLQEALNREITPRDLDCILVAHTDSGRTY
jgi:hypothetical protein